MSILIKLFLFMYLLAMVVATIFSVVSILTAVLTPEWSMKRTFSTMFNRQKGI
jgi:hypothetical protein